MSCFKIRSAELFQFIVSEIPSNLLLKRVGSIWMAFLVVCFGAVAIGTAFIRNYGDLLVTRVFLGIVEGGSLVNMTTYYHNEKVG